MEKFLLMPYQIPPPPLTWALTSKTTTKINIMQNSMMRSILGLKLKDRVSLTTIKKKLPNLKKLCGDHSKSKVGIGRACRKTTSR